MSYELLTAQGAKVRAAGGVAPNASATTPRGSGAAIGILGSEALVSAVAEVGQGVGLAAVGPRGLAVLAINAFGARAV